MAAKKTQDNPVQEVTWQAHHRVQSYFICKLKDAVVHKMNAISPLPIRNNLSLAIYGIPIVVKARESMAL